MYRLCRGVLLAMGKLRYGLTVSGAERVPEGGPLIVAINHFQYVDTFLVFMVVPRRLWVMVKKEALIGLLWRALSSVIFPVDRQKIDYTAMRTALGILSRGGVIAVAPEGTRRKDSDGVATPKGGVAMLAARSGAPILPVYLSKAPGLLGRIRGERLRVSVGEPLRVRDNLRHSRDYQAFSGKVVGAIYTLEGQADRRSIKAKRRNRWTVA
jgi:1-acyl-sn-glycerol-3-phosphate acyltransferase